MGGGSPGSRVGAGGSFWTQEGGHLDFSRSLEKPANLPRPLGALSGEGGGPAAHEPRSHARALIPRDTGHGTRPRLGKRTTCLLGFIRFQEEATGFTLKITKLANSPTGNGFRIYRPHRLKVQLLPPPPQPVLPEPGGAGVIWALLGSPSSRTPRRSGWVSALPGTPPALGLPVRQGCGT